MRSSCIFFRQIRNSSCFQKTKWQIHPSWYRWRVHWWHVNQKPRGIQSKGRRRWTDCIDHRGKQVRCVLRCAVSFIYKNRQFVTGSWHQWRASISSQRTAFGCVSEFLQQRVRNETFGCYVRLQNEQVPLPSERRWRLENRDSGIRRVNRGKEISQIEWILYACIINKYVSLEVKNQRAV